MLTLASSWGARLLGRRSRFAFAFVTVLMLGALACSTGGSATLPPTTGILVRAETLTTGRGCGRSPTQLFKYVVVVYAYRGEGDPSDRANYTALLTSNVFDCYTDGAFIKLPRTAGNASFRLEVYAYNEVSFTRARTVIDGAVAVTNAAAFKDTAPTWTTECTATQQDDVQTLAVCDPLAAGLSGLGGPAPTGTRISLATTSFRLNDGRLASCATPSDAGVADADADVDGGFADASTDASHDAEAGAPAVDAGPPVTFTTARIRYRLGVEIGPTVDVACPAEFLADVSADPATYAIDVGVLDLAGNPLGQTLCAVTSRPGETSPAVCP